MKEYDVTMRPVFSYENTGIRIRNQRKQLHLTQERLAEMADISISFVGAIERGEKKTSLETFVRLAECLKTSTEYLLFGQWEICRQKECSLCAEISNLLSQYR